ncbi:creatininase family protein [Rhizobium sp. B230/85]|uniref:creatininase family protein n=1 Tax=Rhizobium sp. B230/85 TaxID=2819994 RepID=UPI001C5BE04A|nr:creatininase family protein [Rhizobium sp. B230/85]QXZ98188.1 creatininase family protein [Rhizobium sp. B230/85]
MTQSFYWADHSTADFAARDLSETVVILPIAAVEQHGPHLPVQVDAAINAAILDRMVRLLDTNADVLILPSIGIGKSDEHLAYPGTLTVSAQTLRLVWLDVARSVKRAGARKIILFNSHGGQISLMEMTCRDIRVELDMLAVACSWFRIAEVHDLFSAAEITHGIHGGDIETSMMLAIAPELVAMDKAEDFVPLTVEIEKSGSPLTAEGAVGFGWQAQDLHPAGVSGNAANADATKGALVLDRAAAGLVRLIAATGDFDMERLTSETRFSAGR